MRTFRALRSSDKLVSDVMASAKRFKKVTGRQTHVHPAASSCPLDVRLKPVAGPMARRLLTLLLPHAAHATFCAGSYLLEQAISASCSSIGGDLIVTGAQPSSFASGLTLSLIGGNLVVGPNPTLASLVGLRVQAVSGAVSLVRNNALLNFTGLLENASIGGDVEIFGNPVLTSVDGLNRARIGGSVRFSANDVLDRIDALCNATIAGSIAIQRPGGEVISGLELVCSQGATGFASRADLVAAVSDWLTDAGLAATYHGHISLWDVSLVTDLSYLFSDASTFNEHIGLWDTSSVTTMHSMFYRASAFNQDLSGWDVSAVTDMNFMFKEATAFAGEGLRCDTLPSLALPIVAHRR